MSTRSYKTSHFLCHIKQSPLIPALRMEFSKSGCSTTGQYMHALEREVLRLRALLAERAA